MKGQIFVTLALLMFELHGQQPVNYADPFTRTDHMSHTYPGATMPFGILQLSPDTNIVPYSTGKGYNKDVYAYCVGYQYNDSSICGFSHTHFSGIGYNNLGHFLLMPTTGKLKLYPGTSQNHDGGYHSRPSHERESASQG